MQRVKAKVEWLLTGDQQAIEAPRLGDWTSLKRWFVAIFTGVRNQSGAAFPSTHCSWQMVV